MRLFAFAGPPNKLIDLKSKLNLLISVGETSIYRLLYDIFPNSLFSLPQSLFWVGDMVPRSFIPTYHWLAMLYLVPDYLKLLDLLMDSVYVRCMVFNFITFGSGRLHRVCIALI